MKLRKSRSHRAASALSFLDNARESHQNTGNLMLKTAFFKSSFTLPEELQVAEISFDGHSVTIYAFKNAPAAKCPLCERPSRRIHGLYTRTLADLPWSGTPVRLRLRVRKFFCDEPSCERRIFAERLHDVTRPFARGTNRQRNALEWIAFSLGGEAGARLARELGLLVSPDTLLNRIRRAFVVHSAETGDEKDLRVVGVDDFGLKRNNGPATIMVDLERHKIVDLLQGHSTELIAGWLGQHPDVEVVARDRSNVCREGIDAGAPQARQVADRWHLLHNLTQVVEHFLLTKRTELKKAVMPETTHDGAETSKDGKEGHVPVTEIPDIRAYEHIEGPARERHERLVEQWKAIRRLHLAGAKVKDIAEWTGTSRSTVYRYRELAEPPPRPKHGRKGSVLDPWRPYLIRRWNEGCHSAKRLYYEIREQGYSHSIDIVTKLISDFRYTEQQGKRLQAPRAPKAKKGSIAGVSPTARNMSALFMRRQEKLDAEQKAYLDRLCASDAALADAYRLTQEFAKMVRKLDGEKLDGWLAEADASQAEVMRKFAAGLNKDIAAVRAGLTESWSTGPVEGFIHKVKLLKRQGYGRANSDLLRARALAA
ncbi:ISL3 family transposase [Rubrobacter aplysinae]|uniref:ISL3 family transposase n=1 Tax=Rubrobacter aplysinae TaxID=909625 RepID=UPI002E0F00F2|nr:ISL3 family transposase [Rubrobacter aplysinae]